MDFIDMIYEIMKKEKECLMFCWLYSALYKTRCLVCTRIEDEVIEDLKPDLLLWQWLPQFFLQ